MSFSVNNFFLTYHLDHRSFLLSFDEYTTWITEHVGIMQNSFISSGFSSFSISVATRQVGG